MEVFSIVVTYNGKKWLDKCFGSLLHSSIPMKIIAIDNASSDGTPQVIREIFPDVILIQLDKNLGFGQANNIGLKKALDEGADCVFLLNQDAWVETGTIEKLIKAYHQYPEYGILSPVHLNGAGLGFDYGFLNYICKTNDKAFIYSFYSKDPSQQKLIYALDFVNAAFWLIPRTTIETVGGFNPLFYHYGEDRDYVNRCNYFGLKLGIVPEAKGFHDRDQKDNKFKNISLPYGKMLTKLINPNKYFAFRQAIWESIKFLIYYLISRQNDKAMLYFTLIIKLFVIKKDINKSKKKAFYHGLTFLNPH